jgi:metal-responsive CopG/Arc/MetJ family transcriptional regulator
MRDRVRITFDLPRQLLRRLDQEAERRGVGRSAVIRLLLQKVLR